MRKLDIVLTARVLITTSSAARVLVMSVDTPNAPIVALMVVRVLVSIVEFAVNVLTVKDVSAIADTKKLLAVRVLNVAFMPVTVLVVRVDRTVNAFVERVLQKAVAPKRVLTLKALVAMLLDATLLMMALFPRSVLAVRVLIVAVPVTRLGRERVLVASVLHAMFVPVSVLIVKVLIPPSDP